MMQYGGNDGMRTALESITEQGPAVETPSAPSLSLQVSVLS